MNVRVRPHKTVFMFSGQGSQYFQMGRALYDQDPVFRRWLEQLDRSVVRMTGLSVVEALYSPANGKGLPFERTALTHPAIFMVEYALARSLMESEVKPDIALGASLGSFAAAAIAGCIEVNDALTAVVRQAGAFEDTCGPGGMIAVLGDSKLFHESFLRDHSELVAVNLPNHFVISAGRAEFAGIEAGLKSRGVTYQALPVTFAYHSRWIDGARLAFDAAMRPLRVHTAAMPIMCCAQARLLSDLPDGHFWNVARHPIRFREAIAALEQEFVCRYIDVGPAGTLATFLKYGMPAGSASRVQSILSPYGRELENLAAVIAR